VIKIIKDPYSHVEAYTVEFEVEAENAKDLLKELTASPFGQRLIQLLNEAKFLPEVKTKTKEELKAEADKEDTEREEHEEQLRDRGRKEAIRKLFAALRERYGDNFVKDFEEGLNKTEETESEATNIEENREPE